MASPMNRLESGDYIVNRPARDAKRFPRRHGHLGRRVFDAETGQETARTYLTPVGGFARMST